MEELLKRMGIDENADAEEIVKKLELKQSEIMERLDNVEDEARRQRLEDDLQQIEAAITAFSWMREKKQTGIARDEDAVSDDFSDLKNQSAETGAKTIKPQKQEKKTEDKAEAGQAAYIKRNVAYNKKRRRKKLIKVIPVAVIILFIITIILAVVSDSNTFIGCFTPNILYKSEVVDDSPSPYYIALRRMNELQINANCENMSNVIMPYGAFSIDISAAIEKAKINYKDHIPSASVSLNCKQLKELTLSNFQGELELYHLTDRLTSRLDLSGYPRKIEIYDSPNLTDTGVEALHIVSWDAEIHGCEKLKNINISGDMVNCRIYENPHVKEINANADIQCLSVKDIENLTVNAKGDLERIYIDDDIENLTVNGNEWGLTVVGKAANIVWNSRNNSVYLHLDNYDNIEFNEVPLELHWTCKGEEELIIPEGVKKLYLYVENLKNLEIPDGLNYLYIESDTLDFDLVNIPEGTLSYRLYSPVRDERREYNVG